MPLSDVQQLRLKLGEFVDADETEADSIFSDVQVESFLSDAGGNQIRAAYIGWQAKAAEYSNLVDVAEGNSGRNMSDLYRAALDMVKFYKDQLDEGTDDPTLDGRVGRVKIGKISRRSGRY